MNVTIKDMLEAGAHFGHQTRRWNPKMKPYIYKEQNGIYIIDLRSTMEQLEKAYLAVERLSAEGKTAIFVGTKRQAKESVQEDATRSGMYYINERWLGGILTNFKTIKMSMDRLENLEAMEKDGRINQLSKKEILRVEKQKAKLLKVLSGIRGMTAMPSCLIAVDTKKEEIAVKEARKLGLTIIGLVDTNCDPEEVDIAVPANDDAIRSIKLFTRVLADAIIEGRGRYLKNKEFLEDKSKKIDRPEKAEHVAEPRDSKRPSGKKTGADVDIEEQEPEH
ncbi:MAG: 30S ribosomal protein S2 [Candidatus Krumholzibacteria bacterium]|nr:30S ribosomal protein S2 [Candidatus Krumholzibacteria bacterium]